MRLCKTCGKATCPPTCEKRQRYGYLRGPQERNFVAVRTHAEVAAAMGLSVSRVQQLEAKALRKLRIWAEGWR